MADENLEANVRLTATDETVAPMAEFAKRLTDINKSTRAAIEQGIRNPVNEATGTIHNMRMQADRDIGEAMTKSFKTATDSVKSFSLGLTGIGGLLTAAGLGVFVRDSVEAFGQFEEGMTRIQLATGATAAEMAKLDPMFKQLASETGASLATLQDGFRRFADTSGLSLAQVTALFPQISRNAFVSGTDIKTVAAMVNEAITTMHVPMAEIPGLIDAWTKGLPDTEAEFANFFSRVGKNLDAWGMSGQKNVLQLEATFELLTRSLGGGARNAQRAGAAMDAVLESVMKRAPGLGALMQSTIETIKAQGGGVAEILKAAADLAAAQGALGSDEQARLAQQRLQIDTNTVEILKQIRSGYVNINGEVVRLGNALGETDRETKALDEGTSGALKRLAAEWENLTVTVGKFAAGTGQITAVVADMQTLEGELDKISQLVGSGKMDWAAFLDLAGLSKTLEVFIATWQARWDAFRAYTHLGTPEQASKSAAERERLLKQDFPADAERERRATANEDELRRQAREAPPDVGFPLGGGIGYPRGQSSSAETGFPLPHYQSGGQVAQTGPAIVHEGERIIPSAEADRTAKEERVATDANTAAITRLTDYLRRAGERRAAFTPGVGEAPWSPEAGLFGGGLAGSPWDKGSPPRGGSDMIHNPDGTLSFVPRNRAAIDPMGQHAAAAAATSADATLPPGGGTGINRDKWLAELNANPRLKEELYRRSLGENTNPLANQAVMEEAANRADVRSALHGDQGFAGHSNLSYFQGYYRGGISAAQRRMLDENFRKVFVEGSDIARGAIDNSSQWLSAKHEARGEFQTTANFGGDRITGHRGVESFEIPGTRESGAGERAFWPAWRRRQLAEAQQRALAASGRTAPTAANDDIWNQPGPQYGGHSISLHRPPHSTPTGFPTPGAGTPTGFPDSSIHELVKPVTLRFDIQRPSLPSRAQMAQVITQQQRRRSEDDIARQFAYAQGDMTFGGQLG